MPRQSKIDFKRIRELLLENHCLDSNGKVLPPKHAFWSKLAGEYGEIDNKYLYTIVLENRHDVFGVEDELPEADSPPHSSPSKSNCSSIVVSENLSPNIETEKCFIISIEGELWQKLKVEKTYFDEKLGTRKYHTLESRSWTDTFNSKFFAETRLPCSLVFQRAKIHPSGPFYLKIIAACSSCKSHLECVLLEEPKLNSCENVEFRCKYTGDFQNCRSNSKRRVVGERRKEYTTKMIDTKMSASFLHRSEAKHMMQFGDREPSHLPTKNALRLMKSRKNAQSFLHKDPVWSVAELKGIPPYSEAIRSIGLDPFFVHYWTKTELHCYRMAARCNKNIKISIDATGSVVQKVNLPSGEKSKHIFLYEIVLQEPDKCYAVSHMLSARHDANAIRYWLQEWVRSGLRRPPSIVITDASTALMNAVCAAFTQYQSVSEYAEACHHLLHAEDHPTPPTCFLRSDINHTMHTLAGWRDIKAASKNKKNFYLRSLALIISTPNFDEVKQLLEWFFIVLLSQENGSVCIAAKDRLKQKIADHSLSCTLEQNMDEFDVDEPDEEPCSIDEETGANIAKEIDSMYKQALQIVASEANRSDEDNVMYSVQIANKLKKFCRLLPVWSAVMVPIFGYGANTESSGASEGSFNDVKNRIFQHKNLPLRVDEFFITHCDAIMGKMALIKAESLDEGKERSTFDEDCLSPLHRTSESEEEENWRGKIKKEKTSTSDFLLSPPFENPQHRFITNTVASQIVEVDEPEKTVVESEKTIVEPEERKQHVKRQLPFKKRQTYLTPDPTILHTTETSKTKNRIIGLMKNGNIDGLDSVQIDNCHYSLRNTCPFDSVLQILFVCCADSIQYAECIRSNEEIVFELIRNAVRDGVTVQTYRKRAEIYHAWYSTIKPADLFFKVTQYSDSFELDCASTIFILIEKLFYDFPSITSNRYCLNCDRKNDGMKWLTVSISLPTSDMKFFIDCIRTRMAGLQNALCLKCKKNAYNENITPSPLLFIELTYCAEMEKYSYLSVTLSDIPTRLELPGIDTAYQLRGAISFLSPSRKYPNSVGHYIAYCYRNDSQTWEIHNDLLQSIRVVRNNMRIPTCQLIIYSI